MLHVDFETRSELELGGKNSVGLHNYATHPSTKVLMMAYAFGNDEPQLWTPDQPFPEDIKEWIFEREDDIAAWNSSFERYIFKYCLSMDIPISRFQDPQASARYLSLPGDLEQVGRILGLPENLQKDDAGKDLIKLFSYPQWTKKTKLQEKRMYFNTAETKPDDWKAFCDYCKQDVVAEREIARRLEIVKVFPLPERERKVWVFDQQVNDRGIAVEMSFVEKGYELALKEKKALLEQNNELTGLENANSPIQMLAWVRTQGYETNALRKEAVQAELDFNQKLTPLCRQVLDIRKQTSSTAYTKLAAILRQVSSDRRLRNQFLYMGSSRCGRWTGNAVQLHNMARPNKTFENLKNVDELRKLVMQGDYDGIKTRFGSVLLAVKNCIRTSFIPKANNRLRIADLSAIETRVAAWIAECEALLDVFKTYLCPAHPQHTQKEPGTCEQCGKVLETKDPYLDFAVKMTGIPYETLAANLVSKDEEKKAEAKKIRQDSKPAVLGCVYRLSGGEVGTNPKTGDPMKTGLWGYAAGMNIHAPREKWHEDVRVFRQAYREIVQLWYDSEKAVAKVLNGADNAKERLGPNGCYVIDKFLITGRDPILRIKLPSGRFLHYLDARIEDTKMPWSDGQGNAVYRPTFTYAGSDQITKQWSRINSHGGKIVENMVQATARDILTESLLRFEYEFDLPIVAHVHDEGVAENDDDDFSNDNTLMVRVMSEPISWAPGLPLSAGGFDAEYYHK